MASKSANYCCSYLSNNTALLLLCEAELGKPMQELTDASYTAGDDAIAKGLHSTWGKGKIGPKKWKDASCINPTLKGVQMVSASYVLSDSSPTLAPFQATRTSRTRISCTMSTLPTIPTRCGSVTCSGCV